MIRVSLLCAVMLQLFVASLQAQQSFKLSAEEATSMALKNATELKNLRLDKEIQIAKNKEYIAQATPQVNGSLQMQHFFSIPVTLLPDFISPAVYGVLSKNGVKDGGGNPITQPTGPAQFFPAQFGVPWQSNAGVQFQQLLFQPDLFIAISARKKAIDYTDANIKVMEDSVKSNVLRAYYSILIAEKRKHYLDESIQRLEKLKQDQKIIQ